MSSRTSSEKSIVVNSGIPGDHHYPHIPGWLVEYWHLWDRGDDKMGLTPQDQTLIMHLSRFDFKDHGAVEKIYIDTLVTRMGVSRSAVNRYIANAKKAGWLSVNQTGRAATYDYSELTQFCLNKAHEDGWFQRNTLVLRSVDFDTSEVSEVKHQKSQNRHSRSVETDTHKVIVSKDSKKEGKESPPKPPAKVEGQQAGSDKPTPEGQKKKAKSKPRTPQQYRAQLEETEQQRWDILFKALEIGLHGIDLKSLPPAAKARYAPLIHKQVRIAIEFPWMTADDIESFLQWYKKENGGLLPTSEDGFAKWICQFAAQRSELTAHKTPDKNCSTCNGAGQVILKRGSITEAAEYGKCPTCMVEGKTA